jgi:alkanesulfonate monooxygenase SsuD/methylene tetrahydromethanopterin reductase-like flavin-dependent oxidoreductase (luciferase family)
MFRREQEPSTLMAWARRAEALGFDQLWVVEDCFYHGGIAQAAIALAATERIAVGLGINPGVARNPAFLAMEYATLAHAFPGRVIGGIGHGVAEWMEQIGARPASWLTSLEEITTAVRSILRGERVTTDGTQVRLRDVRLEVAPGNVPPVLLGVRGARSLRLGGTCADGVLLVEYSGPDYVVWARDHMETGRREAGRGPGGQVIVYTLSHVDDDAPERARADARAWIAAANGTALQPQLRPMPFAREMQEMIERGGAAALEAGMEDAWIHDLALAGSHVDARRSLARLAGAGADAVILVPPAEADPDAWLEAQRWALATFTT